jgi:carboxypeptidase PM20D1
MFLLNAIYLQRKIFNCKFLFFLFLGSGFIFLPLSTKSQDLTFIKVDSADLTIVEVLQKYLQYPSTSGNEKEAGEFLKSVCKENGLHIFSMGEDNNNFNFAASIFPLDENKPNIIFLNHIDVVSEGDANIWEHNPYKGEVVDDEIWGRGAFDNKGMAIMHLFSIIDLAQKLKNEKSLFNITFLAVSCEETQCAGGVKYVIDNYLDKLNPAVVIGEGPPSVNGVLQSDPEKIIFGISVAQKRPFWLKLELEVETSGHGSVPPLTYANQEMVIALSKLMKKKKRGIFTPLNTEMLISLGKLEKGITGFVFRHPKAFKSLIFSKLKSQPELFALFSNTYTLTNLENYNEEFNVIPLKAIAFLDCRLLPEEDENKFLKFIKHNLHNDRIRIEVIEEFPKSLVSTTKNFFYKNLKTTIETSYPKSSVLPILTPNFNDCSHFQAMGIPAYSSIPVIMDRKYLEYVHTFNERIPIKILEEGYLVFVKFLNSSIAIEENLKTPITFLRE